MKKKKIRGAGDKGKLSTISVVNVKRTILNKINISFIGNAFLSTLGFGLETFSTYLVFIQNSEKLYFIIWEIHLLHSHQNKIAWII